MTTSYPAGLDSYTNPTGSDELDDEVGTRTHSEFHADNNDAIEAIQTELGTDPSGASATVKARIEATETVANAAAQKSSNLSDLANTATAFTNIKQAASETATGVVELATNAEVATGTDTARAVTPAGAAAAYQPLDSDLTAIAALSTTAYGRAVLALADQTALMALVASATTSVEGKVELATDGETAASKAVQGNDTRLVDSARWMSAEMFRLSSVGTPTAGGSSASSYWSFDQTADEAIVGTFRLPAAWLTAQIRVIWCDLGLVGGDVVWIPTLQAGGIGEAIGTGTVTGPSTATGTAPASQFKRIGTVLGSPFTVDATKFYTLQVLRYGSSGSDTLANDALFLGVNLERVT